MTKYEDRKQAGICQSFTRRTFLMRNLPKFSSTKNSYYTVLIVGLVQRVGVQHLKTERAVGAASYMGDQYVSIILGIIRYLKSSGIIWRNSALYDANYCYNFI